MIEVFTEKVTFEQSFDGSKGIIQADFWGESAYKIEIYFTYDKIHSFEIHCSVAFNIFTKLCNHYRNQNVSIIPTRNSASSNSTFTSQEKHSAAPGTTFISYRLCVLVTSYEYNCATYGLCVCSFTQHNVFEFDQCCVTYQCFIPFIAEYHFIVWIYYILFIYQLMDIWVAFTF